MSLCSVSLSTNHLWHRAMSIFALSSEARFSWIPSSDVAFFCCKPAYKKVNGKSFPFVCLGRAEVACRPSQRTGVAKCSVCRQKRALPSSLFLLLLLPAMSGRKIGCFVRGRRRELTPEALFSLKRSCLVEVRKMLGLSALFDTRAEVIAAILFYSFKKSEKKTVAILSRHNLVLSLAGRAKLKEALPLPHHAKHCDDGKKPSKQVTKKGQAQPAQSTVLLKEGQPPGRFSLLPLECFMHILSFLPTKEVIIILLLLPTESNTTDSLLRIQLE